MFSSSRWNDIDTIYLDLDGTLLDISVRYYHLHCDLCRSFGERALSFPSFWQMKREQCSLDQILPEAPLPIIEKYAVEWIDLIESPVYLQYDILLPGTIDVLRELAKKFRLLLITMRRNRQALKEELLNLEISKFFTQVISRAHLDDQRNKWELINADTTHPPGKILIIGDSEQDIETGRRLGFTSVAVTNGIRTESLLKLTNPDLIIRGVGDLPSLLFSGGDY